MREADSDKLVKNLGRELLAYCLYKQGKYREAIDSLAADSTSEDNHENKIMIGQLLAKEGRWPEAVETWSELKKQPSLSKVQRRRLSDLLLMASVKMTESQDWGAAFKCISLAREIHTSNPLLQYLPEEENLPVFLYESENYKYAAEIWEKQLVEHGYSTELIHVSAIVHQCRLEKEADVSPDQKAEFLLKANMYWTALSEDETYWRQIYEKRRAAYNEQVALDSFLEMSKRLGVDRCDGKLQDLADELGPDPEPQYARLIQQTTEKMAVERHSAKLISQLQDQLIGLKGGMALAALMHGSENITAMIQRCASNSIGSPGWMLNRLIAPNVRSVAIHYLNGDYHKCLELVESLNSDNGFNLIGLALIKLAESVSQAQMVRGTRDFAEKLSLIPDLNLRSRMTDLVQDMAIAKSKVLTGRNQIDQAIEFLEEVKEKADKRPNDRAVFLGRLLETLGETYLKRAGMIQNVKDIDQNLADYRQAKKIGASQANLEATYRTIVRTQVIPLANEKKYREALLAIEPLRLKGGNHPYLRALECFLRVWEAANDGQDIGQDKYLKLAEEAYGIDPNDTDFKSIYSAVLSQKAVKMFNDAYQRIQQNPIGFRNSIGLVEELLQKALAIDGSNQMAMNNLLEIQKVKLQLAGVG